MAKSYEEVYVCPKCGEVHDDLTDAGYCCSPKVSTASEVSTEYCCEVCNCIYDLARFAESCCGEKHGGEPALDIAELEAAGQSRLF